MYFVRLHRCIGAECRREEESRVAVDVDGRATVALHWLVGLVRQGRQCGAHHDVLLPRLNVTISPLSRSHSLQLYSNHSAQQSKHRPGKPSTTSASSRVLNDPRAANNIPFNLHTMTATQTQTIKNDGPVNVTSLGKEFRLAQRTKGTPVHRCIHLCFLPTDAAQTASLPPASTSRQDTPTTPTSRRTCPSPASSAARRGSTTTPPSAPTRTRRRCSRRRRRSST